MQKFINSQRYLGVKGVSLTIKGMLLVLLSLWRNEDSYAARERDRGFLASGTANVKGLRRHLPRGMSMLLAGDPRRGCVRLRDPWPLPLHMQGVFDKSRIWRRFRST